MQRVRVGRRVEIELDSAPGQRIPGEVSFVASQANFTPDALTAFQSMSPWYFETSIPWISKSSAVG